MRTLNVPEGHILLDPRQRKDATAYRGKIIERNKYKPHTGKKQLAKAARKDNGS